jgi:hypothetical protein
MTKINVYTKDEVCGEKEYLGKIPYDLDSKHLGVSFFDTDEKTCGIYIPNHQILKIEIYEE